MYEEELGRFPIKESKKYQENQPHEVTARRNLLEL